jgi:hypothetical protein
VEKPSERAVFLYGWVTVRSSSAPDTLFSIPGLVDYRTSYDGALNLERKVLGKIPEEEVTGRIRKM